MKSYLKLVNFEVSRFFNLYLILVGLTIVCQFIGAFIVPTEYMNNANQAIYENQISMSQYIDQYGPFSFVGYLNSGWFMMPIMICIAVLMIYVFFIWYRDWFGKNTFIYRLLMLPTKRVNIYFAKLTTIMLLVFGLIAVQLLLVPIETHIVNSIVSEEFQSYFSFNEIYRIEMLNWLFPNTFIKFILIYGMGLIFVTVLFTAILFERSYRLKGIFFAILYVILSFGVFILPFLLNGFYTNYFYPLEIFIMQLVVSIIVLGCAIWIANHLLKQKIRV